MFVNFLRNALQKTLLTSCCLLASCALWTYLFEPDVAETKANRFEAATGHRLLKIFVKDAQLGHVVDKGMFVKKVWGGKVVTNATGQSIKLTYKREDFDKLTVFLTDNLQLGPHLGNIHHVVLRLENIYQYRLIDFEPLLEYMGRENLPLLEQDFVISMLKVSKFSIQAYQKVVGEFGVEYRPYQIPWLKVRGATGSSSAKSEEQIGYNIFIGYKLYNGSRWVNDFLNMPKLDVWITTPADNAVINQVRSRVKGSVLRYLRLAEAQQNTLRIYLMTRNEFADYWLLQSKARIDTRGRFEGIVKLGTLERGNGHRYSIAAFATYFDINRKVNSKIPFLPFNKGKYVINVKREDNF